MSGTKAPRGPGRRPSSFEETPRALAAPQDAAAGLVDIHRLDDAWKAFEDWQRGDSRALIAYVIRYGLQPGAEAARAVQMLTTRPDARSAARKSTSAMLAEVDARMRRRTRDIALLRDWVERLRRRLTASGCTQAMIDGAFEWHRPEYLALQRGMNAAVFRDVTNAAIFERVGARFRVDSATVEKAYKRRAKAAKSRDTLDV